MAFDSMRHASASTSLFAFTTLLSLACNAHADAQRDSNLLTRALEIPYINVTASTTGAGSPLPHAFVSYSIEFAFFPDFAGNLSNPNRFSDQLLDNLGKIQGTRPYLRVGGNTQDYAVFIENQTEATVGTIIPSISADYPRILTFGPSYFESYQALSNQRFIHGFNLGKNSSTDRANQLLSVPYVCKALANGKLLYWELGNEPDLFKTSAQGIVRPSNYSEKAYVDEWLSVKRSLKEEMQKQCPGNETVQWIAPSFAGTDNSLKPVKTWHEGLDADKDIAQVSSHNYIGGSTQPGVTLQGTLMNHTRTVSSISSQTNELTALSNYTLPFILGETNSLYNQGRPGLSNTFGAALWGLDFGLWCASQSIERVHMHMGLSFRYASWQPLATSSTTKGTKAPYYGNAAVATALGNLTGAAIQVRNLPLPGWAESAYATYADGQVARITVVNMNAYNYTNLDPATNVSTVNNATRPSGQYEFQVPKSCAGPAVIQRLWANGSDAISGITLNGYSYNYELDGGKPVLLANVTSNEPVTVGEAGTFALQVPFSSAAIVQLKCLPVQNQTGSGTSPNQTGSGGTRNQADRVHRLGSIRKSLVAAGLTMYIILLHAM